MKKLNVVVTKDNIYKYYTDRGEHIIELEKRIEAMYILIDTKKLALPYLKKQLLKLT